MSRPIQTILDERSRVNHTLVAAGMADQLDSPRSVALAHDMRAEAARLSTLLFSKA